MNTLKANESLIDLYIESQHFSVLELSGKEAFSRCFEFFLTILIDAESAAKTFLLKTAQLVLPERAIAGVITEQNLHSADQQGLFKITLKLEPRFALLAQQFYCRVFLQKNVIDIVKECLSLAGYQASQLVFHLNKSYQPKPYVLQVPRESDLDFLSRILSQSGIFFWFDADQDSHHEMIYFADNNSAFDYLSDDNLSCAPSSNLPADNSTQAFHELQLITQSIPDGFAVRDYYEETPSEIIESEVANKTDKNIKNYFGVGALNNTQAEAQATLHYQAAQVENWALLGESCLSALMPGKSFKLEAFLWCDSEEFDLDYLMTEVTHEAKQPAENIGLGEVVMYKNQAKFIKRTTPFSIAPAMHPALPTVFTAHIESNGEYALLNEDGKYQIRHQLDVSNKSHTQASSALRRISPYGGTPGNNGATGWHMPLHDGDELLLTCINGDPDRPVILGTLHNASKQNPVTQSNPTQNIIRTQAQNQLLMDDVSDQPLLTLNTKDQQNILQMNATPDAHQLTLSSEQGKVNIIANNNITLESGADTVEETQSTRSHVINKGFSSSAEMGNLYFHTETDKQLSAQKSAFLSAEQDVQLNSGNNLNVMASNGMSVNTGNQVQLTAQNIGVNSSGNIHIIGSGKAPLTIAQGGAGIEITPDGTVNIYGNQISIGGQPIFSVKENHTSGGGAPSSASDVAAILFGVAEMVGGIAGDETGVGEAVQVNGAKRIIIAAEEISGKSRTEIRVLAKEKGLNPAGDRNSPDYPRKWKDPNTGQERLRLDRGHTDSNGIPYQTPPTAGVDHVHAFDPEGASIKSNGDKHFPTTGE